MCKTLMLTLVLFISGVWSQAGLASPSPEKGKNSSDLSTIQGCLKLSRGQYSLIEGDGTDDQLAGATKKLGPLVDHEVELTGKVGIRTEDTTSVGGGSSAIQFPVFEVRSVKPIADTCKSPAH